MAAIALALLLHGSFARAQLSGSAAVVSDYRFRGESLSDAKPAAQVAISYDHPLGVYGGIFASTVQFPGEGGRSLQAVPFAGYTQRMRGGWTWEAGVDYAAFTRDSDYNYGEVYVGVAKGNTSGRLYYASDYFGQHSGALYAEINVTQRVLDRFDLIAHVGALRPLGDRQNADSLQLDARLGAGIDVHGFTLRATIVGTNTTRTIYPIADHRRRNTIVVSIAHSF